LQIEVHLHTTLARQTPQGYVSRLEVALPPGSTLADLAARLGVEISAENTLLVVNGRMAETGQALAEGDVVHLIPALSGG